MGGNLINWTEVICNVIWVVVTLVLIPLIKGGLKRLLPIIVDYFKNKTNESTWNIILSTLQDLIISMEKNITGDSMGSKRKAEILSLLREQGLVTDSNFTIVSNLIDGMVEELTDSGLINTNQWKEWLEEQKITGEK